MHDSSSGERWEIIAELRNTGTEGDERIYGTFEKNHRGQFPGCIQPAPGQRAGIICFPSRPKSGTGIRLPGSVSAIWHMMIDASSQGKGYGSAALTQVIDYIETKPFGDSDRVTLTCKQENQIALKLYHRAGFVETGVEEDGEIYGRIALHS